ncbi:MAG TPA: maleylpyruvate isomerase family mycothiol-dependent enzyme [Acidimicrobiales bacterium]
MPVGNPALPLLRQRERLAGMLADLDDAQWGAASRCDGWSVQDVIAHLVGTNQFWALSIVCSRQGAPTRFLTTFDPVATPEQMVEAVRGQPPAETLVQFVETNAAIGEALVSTSDAEWQAAAEGPLGHIPLCAVVAHALWDSWIHERDIVMPLGLDPVHESDEVALCLSYAAALSPGFLAAGGSARIGAFEVDASHPEVRFVVEVGPTVTIRDGAGADLDMRLTGDAVALVEGLSLRGPLVADVPPSGQWMFEGLAEAFDVSMTSDA